jgi:hypothetical protein
MQVQGRKETNFQKSHFPNFANAFSTILMLTLFSQCLSEVTVPVPGYERNKGFIIIWFHLFKLFPVSNSYLDLHQSTAYPIHKWQGMPLTEIILALNWPIIYRMYNWENDCEYGWTKNRVLLEKLTVAYLWGSPQDFLEAKVSCYVHKSPDRSISWAR